MNAINCHFKIFACVKSPLYILSTIMVHFLAVKYVHISRGYHLNIKPIKSIKGWNSEVFKALFPPEVHYNFTLSGCKLLQITIHLFCCFGEITLTRQPKSDSHHYTALHSVTTRNRPCIIRYPKPFIPLQFVTGRGIFI